MEKLLKKLIENNKNNIPMHMPGHKRNAKLLNSKIPYEIDITEIEGFDNLHNPNGIIKESMDRAKSLYKSKKTFFSVNGSSAGNLAAIRAMTKKGDKIIVARNCHKSVYNAIELFQLKPVYILPDYDEEYGIFASINAKKLKKIIEENQDASLVVITSPSYEGVISDIEKISEICHKNNIPLMVDEAHGAHLFLEEKSALNKGADIVVNSLHKTLPSLTQTAIINIQGEIVDEKEIERQLSIFQSTSPSYILLASIDECINFMTKKGDMLYQKYLNNLRAFSRELNHLKNLKVLCYGNDNLTKHKNIFDFDGGKIVISCRGTNINGNDLIKILRNKYSIECEMASLDYVIAMTSLMDDKKALKMLAKGIAQLDKTLSSKAYKDKFKLELLQQKYTICDCREKNKKQIDFSQSEGKISGEYIWIYPPGIPFIAPGEKIDENIIKYIKVLSENGFEIKSDNGTMPESITIVK